MSVKESVLKNYGYHMVTAVTQQACNAQLRQFLMNATQKNTVYFLDSGAHDFFQVTAQTRAADIPDTFAEELREKAEEAERAGSSMYAELQKLDLLSEKPQEGRSVPANIQTAYYDWYVSYAFLIEDGIPQYLLDQMIEKRREDPTFDPDRLFRIVEFQENGDRVNFNQRFRDLVVLEIYENRGLRYNIVKQPEDEAWCFQFDIQMNFIGGSYSNLPQDVKQRLQEMTKVKDVDTLFEISTLVLNMQTLSTVSSPDIQGVSGRAKELIEAQIIKGYFDRLEKAGGTIFGYAVKPNAQRNKTNYIFAPKQYTFTVSKETLNYIIMFDEETFPEVRRFPWKWMEASEPYNGVMALNRDKIMNLLLEEFMERALPHLKMRMDASIDVGVAECTYICSYPSEEVTEEDRLVLNAEETAYEYSYERSSNSGKKVIYIPPILGADTRFKTKYTVKMQAAPGTMTLDNVTYPSVNIKTRITAWADFMYDSGHSKGTFFDHEVEYQIGIQVHEDGRLDFPKNCIDTDMKPDGIDVSGWSQFCSAWGIGTCVDSMESQMNSTLTSFKKMSMNSFLQEYNTNCNWVMPGNRTFTYTSEGFSDGMDFYAYVNYVQEA